MLSFPHMHIGTPKTSTAHDASAPTHRHWALFKTVKGRVSFVVAVATFLPLAAVGYGAWDLYATQGASLVFDAHAQWTALLVGGLVLLAIVPGKLLGDLLISRKIRRLAEAAMDVADGKTEPRTLPYGLGELDGLTRDIEKIVTESKKIKATMEKEVRIRTSELEMSKGMSELDKARTDALLASIGEGVVATDLDGKISFLNDVAKHSLWWAPDAAMGAPIQSAFRLEDEKEQDIDESVWPTLRVLREGKGMVTPAPTKPYFLKRADKFRFPVKMTISPLLIDGKVVGALTIFNDITIEVDFDRRKSEFISIAAHQLRSPATAIKMMTDMMREGAFGAVSDSQKDWMGKLYNASDLLLDLVNELLNISRLDAGMEIDRVAQDFGELAKKIVTQSEPMLIVKKQSFALAQNGTASPAFDKMMIGEVMKNFISNAHKYSPDGGVITVTVDAKDGQVRYAVTDQGIGIPAADHDKMFGKFFRAGNALSSPIVGTGLGLYYCKTVIEKHGGTIGFDSEVGKGSTFWFTIPV